jgi:hypothetical protein
MSFRIAGEQLLQPFSSSSAFRRLASDKEIAGLRSARIERDDANANAAEVLKREVK